MAPLFKKRHRHIDTKFSLKFQGVQGLLGLFKIHLNVFEVFKVYRGNQCVFTERTDKVF